MSTETLEKEIIMTIYSSQGKNANKVPIKANLLWSEGKKIVRDLGYNIDNMRAIESIRRGILENPKAIMPDQDFNLHLYPNKTKGGAPNRKSITESIKKHIAGHGEKAKNFFNKDKSYTNKPTEELNGLLNRWERRNGPAPDVEVPAPRKKTVKAKAKDTVAEDQAQAINGVIVSLAANAEREVDVDPALTIKHTIGILKGISGHENQVNIEQAVTQLEKALVTKPTPTEEELLMLEHADMAEGIQGIIK